MEEKYMPALRAELNAKATQTHGAPPDAGAGTTTSNFDAGEAAATPLKEPATLAVPTTRVLPCELAAAFEAGATVRAQEAPDGSHNLEIDEEFFSHSYDLALKQSEVDALQKQVQSLQDQLESYKEGEQEARGQAQRDADEIAEKAAEITRLNLEQQSLVADKQAYIKVRDDAKIEVAVQRKYISWLRWNNGQDPSDKPVALTMGRSFVTDTNRVRALGARPPNGASQPKWWVPPGVLVQPFAQWL
jgi:hypothetical protein